MNIHPGGTETRSNLLQQQLSEQIIRAAIEVPRAFRPGLLESAYQEYLAHEFHLREIAFRRQLPLAVESKAVRRLEGGYRIDGIVEDAVILELKCVERLLPVHEAQPLTDLKLTGKRVGLIINFHVAMPVRGGMVRKVL